MKRGLSFCLIASTFFVAPAMAATYENVVLNENNILVVEDGETASNTTALYKATLVVKNGGGANVSYMGYTSSNIAGNPSSNPDEYLPPITVGSSTMRVEEGGTASNTYVGNSSVLNVSGTVNSTVLKLSTGTTGATAENAPKMNITNNGTATGVSVEALYGAVNMSGNAMASNVTLSANNSSLSMSDNSFASNVVLSGNYTTMNMGAGTSAEAVKVQGTYSNLTIANEASVDGLLVAASQGYGESASAKANLYGTASNVTVGWQGSSGYGYGLLNVYDGAEISDLVVNRNGKVNVNGGTNVEETIINSATINGGGTVNLNNATINFGAVNSSGTLNVTNGVLNDVSVHEKANLNIYSLAQASNVVLNGSSTLNVYSDGNIEELEISDTASAVIYTSGTVSNVTVNASGTLEVKGYANASNVLDNAGGMVIANNGEAVVTDLTLKTGGRFDVSTAAIVNITNESDLNAGLRTEEIGGVDHADNWTVNNGSTLTAANNGTIDTVLVQSGGRVVAKTDTSTVRDMTQDTGGMFDFNTSAEVNVVSGSDLNADKVITNVGGVRRADDWTVNGGSILTVDAGHYASNALVQGEGMIVAKESVSTVTDSKIEKHGMFHFSTLADITGIESCVRDPDNCKMLEVHNNIADNWDVNAGSTLEIDNQGTGNNDYVFGGTLYVRNGGYTSNMDVVSGLVFVENGGLATSNTIRLLDPTDDQPNPSEGSSTDVYIGRRSQGASTAEALALYNDISGGRVYVDQYGTLQSNTITGGTIYVNQGKGADSHANVNYSDMSGGTVYVYRSGNINDTEMSGGTINVEDGGKANRNNMTGGTINVASGGNANTTTMSNGTISVNYGGTLGVSGDNTKGTTMTGGSVSMKGTSYYTDVQGGSFTVLNQYPNYDFYEANAYDNTVSGGTFTVQAKSVATRNEISGGSVTVASGGKLNSNTLTDDANVTVNFGGAATSNVMSGGNLTVNGVASSNVVSGGTVVVGANGRFISNVLSDAADVTIGTGGFASSTTMSGGSLTVEGYAENNIVSSGTVNVQNGGYMLSNTFSGADVTVKTASSIESNVISDGTLTLAGTATNNTISGGTVVVQNGGELDASAMYNNAEVTIESGGIASDTMVIDGLLTVKGTASATSMSDGKIVATTAGALVNDLTMTESSVFDFGTNAQVDNASIFGENSYIDATHNAHNWTITDGSILRVQTGGAGYDTVVQSGGILNNAGNSYDTVVNNNGQANNLAGGTFKNLVVNTGGKLDAASGSYIDGNVTIYKNAVLSGDYDYSIIFKSDDLTESTLNIVDGINTGFNNSLVSQGGGNQNTLNLGTDYYQISGSGNNGYTTVSGWNKINVAEDSIVDLDGDLSLVGNGSYISLADAALLNVEDTTSPNTTISGSVHNNGVINLTKSTEQLSEALGTMSMQVHSHALSDGDTTNDRLTITGNYTAGSKAFLRMNVDTTAHTADLLTIGGDVSGTTKLLLDFLTYDSSTQDIPLVQALNDDASTAADFTVWRVYHNPYEWNTTYRDNVWYLAANDEEPEPTPPEPTPPEPTPPEPTPPEPTPPEPDPKPIAVNPEIIAYYSLPEAGLEQVSSIFNNIRDKISVTKIARGNDRAGRYTGGVWEDGMHCGAMNNLWVHATYDHAEITDFTDIEADIKGADFGYDAQADLHNKLGVFASYRDGTYDLNGKGSKYYSSKGAEIDIKSWDVGMYYRFDYEYVWLQAIAYVGKQDVDISTDDGVSASTDGVEFGVGAELGKAYRLVNDFTLEPSLGVFYTQVSYDDIDDEVGNHVEYDTINRLELEAGAKLEKTFRSQSGSSKVYIKPSVIVQKTMNSSVMIDTLGEEETIDDRVLGKIQVGARIALSRALSTYGHVNFRFGDDYEALSGILGLNYAW